MDRRRRRVLSALGGAAISGQSGCLRLSQGKGAEFGNSANIDEFLLNILNLGPDTATDTGEIDVSANEADIEAITGTWRGDYGLMERQTAARCIFEILEDGSTVTTTADRILLYDYKYTIKQTKNSVFVTGHPSIKDSWDIRLILSYQDDTYTLTPTARLSAGAFEFALSDHDIESSRYQWKVKITPPDSFTITLGKFYEDFLINVPPNETTDFPARREAIATVSKLSNSTAENVKAPGQSTGDRLSMKFGGHVGDELVDAESGHILTSQVDVSSWPPIEFGSGTGRQIRIQNLTTGEQLVFEPA